jgi:hypothetical protein
MAHGSGSEKPAWSFLWGKRRSKRHTASLDVRVWSRNASVTARTVDLSALGALIEISDGDLCRLAGQPPGSVLAAMDRIFGAPFLLEFRRRRVNVEAKPVRITLSPDGVGVLFLGCQFRESLGRARLRRLGLDPEQCGSESGAYAQTGDEMSLRADPDRPVTLSISPVADGKEPAPLYVGTLAAASDRSVACALPDFEPSEVVRRLRGHPLVLRASVDGTRLWMETAYVLAVRRLRRPVGLEVVFLADAPPASEVLAYLGPRTGSSRAAGRRRRVTTAAR